VAQASVTGTILCYSFALSYSAAFFALHKVEERAMEFFPALSEITGIPVPRPSLLTVLLYAFAAAWLLVPFLINRGNALGYYLAWTFLPPWE